MIRISRFLLLLVFLGSCNDSEHFGYERLNGTIHYRLLSIGDENLKVKMADHVSMRIDLIAMDTLRAIKDYSRIDWKKSKFPKYFYDLFEDALHGDNISLVGTTKELQINSIFDTDLLEEGEDEVEIRVHIYEALSDEHLREAMAAERLRTDSEILEKSTLLKVLDSLGMSHEDFVDVIYFKSVSETNGKLPIKGDYITVNYSTRLGNGVLVDDNYGDEGISYEVGKPDQVIPGFIKGIEYLSEGSEAFFVIPSEYGFGENGSSSGIIPGYSVLVYRARLQEIRD
jgi:FKBP-type peptidyl-prolyl cis-trans isomerase